MSITEKPDTKTRDLSSPPGFKWVFNRMNRPLVGPAEPMFGGVPYPFDPHAYRLLPEDVAKFIVNQSLIPGTLEVDPFTGLGTAEHRLAGEDDAMFGVPFEGEEGQELFNRNKTDKYFQGDTQGVATTAQVVAVGTKRGTVTGTAPAKS